MINEEAINRASERFGYFPNGFTSYRETLTAFAMQMGYYSSDGPIVKSENEQKIFDAINACQQEVGSVGMIAICHTWAEEFEERYKGKKWGEDEGPEWLEAIDEFFVEKCKTLEA